MPPPPMPQPPKLPIQGVKNLVAVASGKGGVGKTTVAVNLALALKQMGASVGLLDADVYGPNVPIMLGTDEQPQALSEREILPVEAQGLKMISMGLLNPGDKPMIWRGPMLHSVMQQFLRSVVWGELDYLLIDLPPGTGDVQLSLIQLVPVTGAVLVTTPSTVALADVRKAMEMFRQVNVDILGIVENMSFFNCPHCQGKIDVFGHGEGRRIADTYGVPLLGEIEIDPQIRIGGDTGKPVALLGELSSVWPCVVIRGDVNWIRIGSRTNIQDGSVLHVMRDTHPLQLGDQVTVGHGVILHGCTIESRVP